ncbi:MAG: hypothetical protein PVF74_13410 [Anaerolineales bacterium]
MQRSVDQAHLPLCNYFCRTLLFLANVLNNLTTLARLIREATRADLDP